MILHFFYQFIAKPWLPSFDCREINQVKNTWSLLDFIIIGHMLSGIPLKKTGRFPFENQTGLILGENLNVA